MGGEEGPEKGDDVRHVTQLVGHRTVTVTLPVLSPVFFCLANTPHYLFHVILFTLQKGGMGLWFPSLSSCSAHLRSLHDSPSQSQSSTDTDLPRLTQCGLTSCIRHSHVLFLFPKCDSCPPSRLPWWPPSPLTRAAPHNSTLSISPFSFII